MFKAVILNHSNILFYLSYATYVIYYILKINPRAIKEIKCENKCNEVYYVKKDRVSLKLLPQHKVSLHTTSVVHLCVYIIFIVREVI